jgi:hypothetical protein
MEADQAPGGNGPKYVQLVLERLVRSQKPTSYFATTVVREAGRPEVHLAFVDTGDARKLADAVEAKATTSYPGWASQRAFQLDDATVTALAASLPPPRIRPKQRSSDGSPVARAVRRGPRMPVSHDD